MVVAGDFGEDPVLRLSNVLGPERDSQPLWLIVQICLAEYRIEEILSFVKQSSNPQDKRLMKYKRLKSLVVLVTAAAYLAVTFPGRKPKLRLS